MWLIIEPVTFYCTLFLSGVDVSSNPPGTHISGMNNRFDYRILSSVTLTCTAVPDSGSLPDGITYQWNTDDCYTNAQFTGDNPECFPYNQMMQQSVTDSVIAHDSGTVTCTARINSKDFTSEPFTLRISGKQLVCIGNRMDLRAIKE